MKNLSWCGLSLLCLIYLFSALVNGQNTCEDRATWCESQKTRCEQSVTRQVMSTYCRKTCKFCDDNISECTKAACEQECEVIDGRARCSCAAGYVLGSDGRSCSDIDECLFERACPNPQLPTCQNTVGSFVCSVCPANQINYYQSTSCCEKSSVSSCGQNSITGVQTPPGPDSKLGLWPWTILILVGGKPCTGALISNEWAIAAAHCFSSRGRNTAVVAQVGIRSTNRNDSNRYSDQVNVDRVVVHGNYDFPNNNIALVHLDRSVQTSWAVRTICLPNGEVPQESGKCWMSGFEALYYGNGVRRVLVDSGMLVTRNSACSERLGSVGRRSDLSSIVCARFEEKRFPACAAETGGPIVCQRCSKCDFYIAGIMSYGDLCQKSNDDAFAAFTSIESYEQWISEVTSLPVNRNGVCTSRRASWRPWGRYSTCTRTCGGGEQSRSRVCNNGEPGNPGCEGRATEVSRCNEQPCPVWSRYSRWSDCSVTCGNGVITRTRTCLHGTIGQEGCNAGTAQQMEACREKACPFWDGWSHWTACDHSCGPDGIQLARRRCIGGEVGEGDCVGGDQTLRACNRRTCPTWSEWSPFSACSQTCGRNLMRSSNRVCLHGSDCEGRRTRFESCGLPHCPELPTYSSWSECSVTCGVGEQTRRCLSNCDDAVEQVQRCALEDCADVTDPTVLPNGRWGEWTVMQPCDVTCGEGEMIRHRDCLEGATCQGHAMEVVACQLGDCPPHPGCATAENHFDYCGVVKNLCKVSKVIRERCPRTCLGC